MKMIKLFIFIVFLFFIALMIYFFIFSDSYQKSMKARVKYQLGNYKEAYSLAQEAYELDKYNKMAFSILTQSKIAFKMLNYIDDAKNYLKDIDKIVQQKTIAKSDKMKIKVICDVMVERYKRLNPTPLTNKELYDECTSYYKKFKRLQDEL